MPDNTDETPEIPVTPPPDSTDPTDEVYGLGALPSPPDPRDKQLPVDTAAPLPPRWILGKNNNPRISMPPHLNQHSSPMCGGFSGAGLKRFQEKVDKHGVLNLDPVWLYYESRKRTDLPAHHIDGTYARAVLATLLWQGIPIKGRPNTASRFKIASYAQVPFSPDFFKRAIQQYQGPLLVGMAWPDSFFRPIHGVAPKPNFIAGGHLIIAIGYDDNVAGGSALLYNSWGNTWGGSGNIWVPYRYLFDLIHDLYKVMDVRTNK